MYEFDQAIQILRSHLHLIVIWETLRFLKLRPSLPSHFADQSSRHIYSKFLQTTPQRQQYPYMHLPPAGHVVSIRGLACRHDKASSGSVRLVQTRFLGVGLHSLNPPLLLPVSLLPTKDDWPSTPRDIDLVSSEACSREGRTLL